MSVCGFLLVLLAVCVTWNIICSSKLERYLVVKCKTSLIMNNNDKKPQRRRITATLPKRTPISVSSAIPLDKQVFIRLEQAIE